MRLTSLTLTHYGPFRAHRVTFDPAPGRINLLIAPNGAGKSVLRRAFCDLLFSIPNRSEMGFRFGLPGMRLVAEAVAPDGAPFVFGRRRGQGNTLIGPEGLTLEPGALARLLGHTDKVLLERLFALDTERLRGGGAELLASGGTVAEALLSAAGGLRQARQLRTTLEERRDALAPERKTQGRPFYKALDQLLEARRRLDATVLKPATRERQQTELQHLKDQLHLHRKQAEAASARISRLERVRRVAGPLRQFDEARGWLAAHPGVPKLPADTAARLAGAVEAVGRAALLVERDERALAEATSRAAETDFDTRVLDASDAIDALVAHAGSAAQARRDTVLREFELSTAEQEVVGLLHQLGLTLSVERAGEAIPRDAVIAEARRLMTDIQAGRAELERLPDEGAAASRDLAATEAALHRLPPADDVAALLREITDIRRGGDPVTLLRAARQAVAACAAARAAAWAHVSPWRERAAAQPVQPLATYERLDLTRGEAAARLHAAREGVERRREEAAAEQARLQHIAAGGRLPDEQDVAAARSRRDAGWRLVRRRAFAPDPPAAAEEAGWAGDLPLPLAYERAVAVADDLADLRNRESDRVARIAEMTRRMSALRSAIADADSVHAEAAGVHETALSQWRAALAPLGLPAEATLAEMRVLLAGRERVIDAEHDHAAALSLLAACEAEQADAGVRLQRALGETADRPPGPGDLPGLLALAEQRVGEARAAEQARALLAERRQVQVRAAADKQAALDRATGRMAELLAEWNPVRLALQRPADEPPGVTAALLDQFARLDKVSGTAAGLRQRLREMRHEVAALAGEARALATRVAPDCLQLEAVAIVDTLRRRLSEQRGLARQRGELLAQVERAAASLAVERERQQRHGIALRALLAGIGAADVAAAEPLVALAAEAVRAAETLRRAETDLAAMGDGRTPDALREEVANIDSDAIAGAIAAEEQARDAAWQQAQTLAAHVATEAAGMQAQAGETAAAQAEYDRQAAAATLARVLDEAVVLQLAGLMLEDALGAIDAAGTSALLARIGGLFRTLTGGAYGGILAEDHGDGGARLLAVEHGVTDEPKPVTALSDGTRDQLFLALRLASIEEHVATAPPLPFLADDILQTFDDRRAQAALRALVDLSAHVQVIVLSHHPHVMELARGLGADQVHACLIEPQDHAERAA